MKDYRPDALDARDPAFIEAVLPLLESFSARYLRLRSEGTENAPAGPAMFVANHNGGIVGPDLFCTLATLWRLFTPKKPLYALAHDFAMRQFTPLGRVLQRAGAVAACRDNARRVLETGGQLLVYPGGDLDAYRRFDRRNEVVILPRTATGPQQRRQERQRRAWRPPLRPKHLRTKLTASRALVTMQDARP